MDKARVLVFGAGKTGKTKNFCETAPGPVLLMNFDNYGWSSITKRKVELLKDKFSAVTPNLEQGAEKVFVRDYSQFAAQVKLDSTDEMNITPITDFILDINWLATLGRSSMFGTIVVDPITMWDTCINSFVGGKNSQTVLRIQDWGQAASKKEQIINFVCSMPTNVVFIGHEEHVSDKISGQITILPLATGKTQAKLPMLFSQVVYSEVVNDAQGKHKFQLRTQPFGMVKGLGLRWPQDRPAVVENSWKGLFGI